MFGSIGGSELLVILVLALLLFGPRRLPQIGRSIGRALAEFRSATNEFRGSLEREVEVEQIREARDELTAAGREPATAQREASRPGVARGASVESAAVATPSTHEGGTENLPERSSYEPASPTKS